MGNLTFAAGVLALTLYSLVLGIVGIVRWARRRLGREARPPLKPIWKQVAGLPLLLWPVAIAAMVPNWLDAVERARTMWTMADIRRIATAAERYAVDHNAYPVAQSMDELSAVLEPTYIDSLPRRDQWGSSYRYSTRDVQASGPQEYLIISLGSDGVAEPYEPWGYPRGATVDYRNDIVYSQGAFVRYPEGRCC